MGNDSKGLTLIEYFCPSSQSGAVVPLREMGVILILEN